MLFYHKLTQYCKLIPILTKKYINRKKPEKRLRLLLFRNDCLSLIIANVCDWGHSKRPVAPASVLVLSTQALALSSTARNDEGGIFRKQKTWDPWMSPPLLGSMATQAMCLLPRNSEHICSTNAWGDLQRFRQPRAEKTARRPVLATNHAWCALPKSIADMNLAEFTTMITLCCSALAFSKP